VFRRALGPRSQTRSRRACSVSATTAYDSSGASATPFANHMPVASSSVRPLAGS